LYESTLIFRPYVYCGDGESEAIARLRHVTNSLKQSRKHRFTHLWLLMYTPDDYHQNGRPEDGEVLGEACEALAIHQPVWTNVQHGLVDMTVNARYNAVGMIT